MSTKPYKRIVAANGKYTNKDGDEKTRWLTVGTLFQKEDGSFSAKIEALPCGPQWDGWLNFFEIEDRKKSTQDDSEPAPF